MNESFLKQVHFLEVQCEALRVALPQMREAAGLYEGQDLQTRVKEIAAKNGLAEFFP